MKIGFIGAGKVGFSLGKFFVQDGSFPEPVHTFAKSDCSDEYLAQLDAEL